MLPPIRMEAIMAMTMRRLRPKRMAASLPATLAKVPIRPRPVATMAGERTAAALAPVVIATYPRKATPHPRSALISSVCMQ